MTSPRERAQHFVDQLSPLGPVSVRRFFGGWALTLHGVQFAFVMDTLYLCADDRTRPGLVRLGSVPFEYEKKTGTVKLQRYLSAPDSALDDDDALCALARDALKVAAEKPKKQKR